MMEPAERHVRHFQEELEQLKNRLLEMGGLAEEKVRLSVKGLVDRDPECDLNIVTGSPRHQKVRVAISNSFGFGGSNSCIVLRNPSEVDGAGAIA